MGGPMARRNPSSLRNLQIWDGSLIITGLFGAVKRSCGIISIYDVNL
jgi:hypothetical protein